MKRVNVASALIYDDQGHKFAPVFIMVYVMYPATLVSLFLCWFSNSVWIEVFSFVLVGIPIIIVHRPII
ncbi:hypothetical protein BK127_32880 [Paenibacillus sp. FSL H7-0331]|nr:hypothetical protein BK127_32880 [Paenibacillus sp. FSL H7-0331]